MPAKNHDKALRDYLEAYRAYHDKLDEYFPVRQVVPGKPIRAGKPITKKVRVELDKLGVEVEEKRNAWIHFTDPKRKIK